MNFFNSNYPSLTETNVNAPKNKLENIDTNDISVPDELTELMIEVVASEKPLLAIYLIKVLSYRRMLCFVKSIDTAKRLCKLFELNGINAVEYSSSLHVARRKRIQQRFEKVLTLLFKTINYKQSKHLVFNRMRLMCWSVLMSWRVVWIWRMSTMFSCTTLFRT